MKNVTVTISVHDSIGFNPTPESQRVLKDKLGAVVSEWLKEYTDRSSVVGPVASDFRVAVDGVDIEIAEDTRP
jgi:hypothetical protein